MGPMPPIDREAFLEQMRQVVDDTLRQVAEAINQAPDGAVITASEEKVRDLFGDLRRRVYETALQMKIDAAQAAFPPSEGSRHRQEPPQ